MVESRTIFDMRRLPGMSRGQRCYAALIALVIAMSCCLPSSANAAATTPPVGWLHTSGSKILTAANKTHTIKAINWFGLETSNCAPHGLWQISLDAGLAQIASFGFNTIRLPYSNECLTATEPTSIDYTKNPDLVGKTPLQIMDAVVVKARQYGLSVILDRHRPDFSAQSELWYTAQYSEARWIADWTMLAKRYKSDSTVIGFDLHNEPRGTACWGCGIKARDWAAAATRAGNAVLAVNPKLLIIIEGVEKQATKGITWWGGGLADAATRPIKLKVANRLVYSTHDYPASVFAQKWFSAKNYPANLAGVWTSNWGFLQRKNVAPVLIGEFGTKLQTSSDRQWLTTLVSYIKQYHFSFAYWSFNPNSGDTGGLLADDWVTPQQAKLTALRPILGPGRTVTPILPPPAPTPTPAGGSSSTPSIAPTKSPSQPPRSSAPSSSAPSSSAPSSSAPSSSAPSSSSGTPTGGGLDADWLVTSSWPGGYVAEVTLTADAAAGAWKLDFADPDATAVVNAWGMTCEPDAGRITCDGAGWAENLAMGQSVTVGLQVASPTAGPPDPDLTVR